MARAIPNYEGPAEFWKPAARADGGTESGMDLTDCPGCGAQFVPDSFYCHVCGSGRQAILEPESAFRFPAWLQLATRAVARLASHSIGSLGSRLALLRDALGQTNASLATLIAGSFCLLAALF